MSFASKLGSDLKDLRDRASGPSSYKPAGPDSGAKVYTPQELMANSAALRQKADRERPPPPPRRGVAVASPAASPPISSGSRLGRASSVSTPSPPLAAARFSPAPSTASYAAPPPPASRGTTALQYAHTRANDIPGPATGVRRKPFSQYGREDKEDFFESLDQFFGTRLKLDGQPAPARASAPARQLPPPFSSGPTPPPPSSTARPPLVSSPAALYPTPTGSYPPPQTHSSSALSLLHYVLYAPYPTAWFASPSPTPPPLTTRTDIRLTMSWSQLGDAKSLTGFALFGDASVAWWHLSWSAREESSGRLDPTGQRGVKKEGRYRPIPSPWDGEQLYAASERFAPGMIAFAEGAVRSGKPVARGECWDVASEALNSVQGAFPSIGRTHGHLMYYGKAGEGGKWRGGESYVRPGDVVEWRTVTIAELDGPKGGWSTLGDPDHTAVIVGAGTPTQLPTDGEAYPIAALVSLTVVEQSQGAVPVERTYDMTAMSKGEVWIYRPVPLVDYVGTAISADWPPACQSWEVGQLE